MQRDELIRHEIESMLRQKIGLNPESVGSRSILRAVKKGMRTGKMQGLTDYLSGLQASPQLFESLVESVVVPETSFFRNRASFVFLRQWIAHEWQGGRPLRVLSLPCSTGEEPYSITITLLEEGLGLDEFHIDAVDISTRALEKAKQGIYSPYAFRRQTYRNDDKYFTLGMPEGVSQGRRITQRYFLTETVRNKVCFRQGNVLDPNLLIDQPPYDIIFCRNLLIYFDQDARDRTFQKLTQLLCPNGLLFLGYAETSMVDSQQYRPIPYPQTFAYRKNSLQSANSSTASSTASSSAESTPLPVGKTTAIPSLSNRVVSNRAVSNSEVNLDHKTGHRNASPSAASAVSASPESNLMASISTPPSQTNTDAEAISLQSAQQLADKGEIESASTLCDRYLVMHPSEAAAHLLRGELHQASGNEQAAETCFEKAIYLDPHLSEALTHLMFLKEEKQDAEGAAVIKERIKRLG